MKRYLLGFIAMMLSSMSLIAQTQFSIGIKGGLNFAKLNVDNSSSNSNSRTGVHGGGFALFKINEFAIQPEVILSQQGSKTTINSTNFESNFNYINVPILFKYYLVKGKNGGGINLHAGPQLGFLQKAKADVFDSVLFILNKDQDVKRSYKKTDVSVALGAGWDSPFGLSIDLRYNLGLRRIEEDENIEATRNQVFQVSIGFKLMKFGY
ncbi:MAG: PorT family protein [Cyclobacteriaceae bacterium]|nr:PorT family protein [Cyclobacteriaceae bacterium]